MLAVCLWEGFMCGTTVIDKDGISAAVVTAEMTAYLYSQGTTVLQQLSHLHDKFVCSITLQKQQAQLSPRLLPFPKT